MLKFGAGRKQKDELYGRLFDTELSLCSGDEGRL